MFRKVGLSGYKELKKLDKGRVLADPRIVDRFNKLASQIRNVAQKSDDFLYFSIIFLKSAEASLIDDDGNTKVLSGGEKAWGYFDKNWKWNGNVQPHRNNNGDIFPEVELKKASSKWVGLPLCRDHESSSIDGIRGIILDTHYDEKLKQVVGLCALDSVNYPDLARKVKTGLVRYGSMGTAVETSVCTDCGNYAQTQEEYCQHVTGRTAYGEINVGLSPIEYSLVVQPAEPAARLLSCIASLNNYREEFVNYGVQNVDTMLGSLSGEQAAKLNHIMKNACDETGCSLEERRRIVSGFLNNLDGNIEKKSKQMNIDLGELVAAIREANNPNIPENQRNLLVRQLEHIESEGGALHGAAPERIVTDETVGSKGEIYTNPLGDGVGGRGIEIDPSSKGSGLSTGDSGALLASPSEDSETRDNVWDAGGAIQEGELRLMGASNNSNKIIIQSLLEDIMNESRLRKRAELRRRIAYHQGGADGVEPNTYKAEKFDRNKDKQMQQTGNMGGDKGTFPGDSQVKEKLSRAELEQRKLRREAYHQGGSDGVEPNTYKAEKFDRNKDKQMQQTGNMGGDKGTFPGDSQVKEKQSRAAYRGPALRTKFAQKRAANGTVNKSASVFSVYAGPNLVLSATAGEIFGPELNENWDWITSKDYGKEVVKQIRTSGIKAVSSLLKESQDLAPPAPEEGAPPAPVGAATELPTLPDLPDLPGDEGLDLEGGEEDLEGGEEEASPSERAESALMEIEDGIAELREIIGELSGESDNVNIKIDVNEEGALAEAEGADAEQLSLASNVLNQLKISYAELNSSADEIAMIVETYQGAKNLSKGQIRDLARITNAAIRDANVLCGESTAVCKVARTISSSLVKTSEYVEGEASATPGDLVGHVGVGGVSTDSNSPEGEVAELVSEAMNLRKQRRQALVDSVEKRSLDERRLRRESIAKKATQNYALESGTVNEVDDDAVVNEVDDDAVVNEVDDDAVVNEVDDEISVNASDIKDKLNKTLSSKKHEEDREAYRLKLRRAYDLGMEMQRKGLTPQSKSSLDRQVDEIMLFDDRAFEAFKRSISNTRPINTVKIASDLGGVNVGIESTNIEVKSTIDALATMWD